MTNQLEELRSALLADSKAGAGDPEGLTVDERKAVERMTARASDLRMDYAMEQFDREAVKKLLAVIERRGRADLTVSALRAALRSTMAYLHGLCCPGCKAQGRELNKRCCKDADCDAGFYGIDAEFIASLLMLGDALMPGTLAEIETPEQPVNIGSVAAIDTDEAGADFTARRCNRFQSYEDQGTGYDSGASGHELQGRKASP